MSSVRSRRSQPGAAPRDTSPAPHEPAFDALVAVSRHTSIVLENKGSVARDHLANERTFLAWIRTACTFLTLAIGFLQIYVVQEMAYSSSFHNEVDSPLRFHLQYKSIRPLWRPITLVSVAVAVLSIAFGAFRYLQVQALLMRDLYPATRLTMVSVTVSCTAILVLILVFAVKITT